MPVIDGDLFSPRIRVSRCDVRTKIELLLTLPTKHTTLEVMAL